MLGGSSDRRSSWNYATSSSSHEANAVSSTGQVQYWTPLPGRDRRPAAVASEARPGSPNRPLRLGGFPTTPPLVFGAPTEPVSANTEAPPTL
jgi:hypothetical protein